MAESEQSLGVSLSSYNRQHPMAYDEGGERYDPLVRDIAKYRALFADPQEIDAEYIKKLPLSVGLLRSFAVFELGMENAKAHFYEIERKYGNGNLTDVFSYVEAVNEMKRMIQDRKTQGQGPFGGGPGTPPSTAAGVREKLSDHLSS